MQLQLDREDLQLLAEVLEARVFELRREANHRPDEVRARSQAAEMEAMLDRVISRRLEFGCDELDALCDLLNEACRHAREKAKHGLQEQRYWRLQLLRDKVVEVCAMT